jgi:transposase
MSISVKKCWEIVFLSQHRRGSQLGIKEIAKEVDVSKTTVKKWLQRYKDTGDVIEEEHPGKPKLKSSKMVKIINSAMESGKAMSSGDVTNRLKRANIEVSQRTVKRRMAEEGYHYGTTTSKPFFKLSHIERRLEWANNNLNRDWSKVVFTDETTIQLFQNPSRVWKKKGKKFVVSTVKHPPKVHVWGCFSSKEFGRIVIFTGIMDSFKLCKIYAKALLPSASEWFDDDWTLCEDNDPKHTSKYSKQWKLEHLVDRMDWPAQLPDQNPIENV